MKAMLLKCDAKVDETAELIKDFNVVLNCVGLFYEYWPKLLKAAIKAGVNYVGICDDYDSGLVSVNCSKAKKRKIYRQNVAHPNGFWR